MLELLAEREAELGGSDVERRSNTHMVAINDALGFQVTGRAESWRLAAAPAE